MELLLHVRPHLPVVGAWTQIHRGKRRHEGLRDKHETRTLNSTSNSPDLITWFPQISHRKSPHQLFFLEQTPQYDPSLSLSSPSLSLLSRITFLFTELGPAKFLYNLVVQQSFPTMTNNPEAIREKGDVLDFI